MNTTILNQPAVATPSALLQISGLRLLLPQNEIFASEAVDNVEMHDARAPSVGWLRHEQIRCPVYCLSQDLSLLTTIPAERRTCVLLRAVTTYFGILCDSASVIPQTPDNQNELPLAMRLPESPIQGLVALNENGIACLTSTNALAMHIVREVKSK
jgi:hypothetical protein